MIKMKKINKLYLNKLFDKYLDKTEFWLRENRLRVFFFTFLVAIWSVSSRLPYLNLVFTTDLVIFLISVSFFIVFQINWRIILYFCFGLFFISYFFDILGLLQLSELLGDYIYGYLALVVIKYFLLI